MNKNKVLLIFLFILCICIGYERNFAEYITNDSIDTQKFIDENVVVETQAINKTSDIYKKIIIKNNSDYFINGIPYKLVDTAHYNAEIPGQMMYLFLRPHEEISYYSFTGEKVKAGIQAQRTSYSGVISMSENRNIDYANDLTMKIDNQLPNNKGVFNVTFVNKLDRNIVLQHPYSGATMYCDSIYGDYDLDLIPIYPGHNKIQEVSVLPGKDPLTFVPGENEYTVNINPSNESIIFSFAGNVNNQFIQEVSQYPEYKNLIDNKWDAIY